MKIYLVGGAVRDSLLNIPVTERDWVVVGATPKQMIEQGYRPVGKDFPVFLHPETSEEYALARTERKTAKGYHGFEFHASQEVTLEDDLRRRDLTINAIAKSTRGDILDPFNGREDIRQRLLRHVSPAFAEDPVRILRIARFAARFHSLGFRIAEATLKLMQDMVRAGEVDALVPERVWQETRKALCEDKPSVFFETLRSCNALAVLFPEVEELYGVPQPAKYHPEIDSGVHTMMVIDQAAKLSNDIEVRFAALTHDLGKATTPKQQLPGHRGHEARGVGLIEKLCNRLKIPNHCRDLAKHVSRYHLHCHRVDELRASTKLEVLEALDAFRRPERFEQFLLTCEADARGRKGLEDNEYRQANRFRAAQSAAARVETQPLLDKGITGKALGKALREKRIEAISLV